jgi:hypothetical protein
MVLDMLGLLHNTGNVAANTPKRARRQVASNIICKVVLREEATLESKGIRNKRGRDGESYWEHTTERRTQRFWRQRKMAEEELSAKETPCFDSSAYLREEAW